MTTAAPVNPNKQTNKQTSVAQLMPIFYSFDCLLILFGLFRTRGAARLLANANAFSEDNPPKATMAKPRHRAGYRLTA